MGWNACILLVDVFSDESVPQKDLTACVGLALFGAGYAYARVAELEAAVGKDETQMEVDSGEGCPSGSFPGELALGIDEEKATEVALSRPDLQSKKTTPWRALTRHQREVRECGSGRNRSGGCVLTA